MSRPLRIAVREYADFENALAEEIALYRKSHPEVEFEAVQLDLHRLRAELFEKEGLRSGLWDIGYLVTDWLAEAVEEKVVEDLTPYLREIRARRLPRSRNLPAFAAILNDVATAALTTHEPSADILKKAQQRIAEQRITFR